VAETRGGTGDDAAWADAAARANVRLMCSQLLERSPLLVELVDRGSVQVAGLFYRLHSGELEVVQAPGSPRG
jgi:carbonic anhydrase